MKHIPWYRGWEWRSLDEGVYRDYAERLLPLAVGYSAGLLKYFFRGDLYVRILVPSVDEVTFNPSNLLDTGRNIDKVAVLIQNNSKLNGEIEPVGEGNITLIASYTDKTTGETVYRHGGTLNLGANGIPPFGGENYLGILFTLGEPIPTETAKDVTYSLIFRGALGEEKDAVIGKVIKGSVLYSVSPDEGTERDIVTITGDMLPEIPGPYPVNTNYVRFNHTVEWPYSARVTYKTDSEITVEVPNTAALEKPGYGGLRVKKVYGSGETEETIFSNPIPFFPIADGIIQNLEETWQNVTMEAVKPISGDFQELPRPIVYPIGPNDSQWIQLITGYTYRAVGETGTYWSPQDIYTLTPYENDFEFDVGTP
jgi:hypothetical protein